MKQRFTRRGAALLAVLVAISAIIIILSVTGAQVIAQRKLLHARQHKLQADWLARAGVECAAERLLQKPDAFKEERSDLVPQGIVNITVEKDAQGHFVVTSDASVGAKEMQPIGRTERVRFRRTEKDGVVRLEAVPSE
jgi:hypothetical protein